MGKLNPHTSAKKLIHKLFRFKIPIKFNKKYSAFVLLFLFGILIFLIFNAKDSRDITITVGAGENKFKLNFDIPQEKQPKLDHLLDKLALPLSIKNGFEFELDATSSAALAFSLPVQSILDIEDNTIKFEGTFNPTSGKVLPKAVFRVPASTNFAIYAQNLQDFINQKLILPEEIANWLNKNLYANEGQIMVIFGKNAQFALITHANEVNFEDLKNIQISSTKEPIYKKDLIEEFQEVHLLKIPQNNGQKETTFALFQTGNWLFFTSSIEAATDLIKINKSQLPSLEFNPGNGQEITMAFLYQNSGEYPINEQFGKFLFGERVELVKFAEKISFGEFAWKKDQFSGLINLK